MKKIIALTFAASTLFLAGCCRTDEVIKWEYKEVSSIKEVNKAADEGWMVAGFSTHTSSSNPDGSGSGTITYGSSDTFLLKRPKK